MFMHIIKFIDANKCFLKTVTIVRGYLFNHSNTNMNFITISVFSLFFSILKQYRTYMHIKHGTVLVTTVFIYLKLATLVATENGNKAANRQAVSTKV